MVEMVTWDNANAFATAIGGQLPTEAQWEFAARGGKYSKGYIYSGSNNADDVVWHYGNSGGKTNKVGTKAPNELGIYDMSGNVFEWVNDWHSDTYPSGPTDPTGAETGTNRVFRDGSYNHDVTSCKITIRLNKNVPSYSSKFLGFRVVLPIKSDNKKISMNTGTNVSVLSVPQGAKIIQLPVPTKTHYNFLGWYKDEALEYAWNLGAIVTEDITIFAKWEHASSAELDNLDNWNTTLAATCIEAGNRKRTRTCTVSGCGYSEVQTETASAALPKLEHAYTGVGELNTVATCTSPKLHFGKCVNGCELDSDTETVPVGEKNPDNHDYAWVANNIPATCSAKATETEVCTRDEAHRGSTQDVGEFAAHTVTWTAANPATCVAKATETGACTLNPEHTIAPREVGEIDATAHALIYGEWVIATPSTNTAEGRETRTVTCSNSAAHTFQNEVRAIDKTAITDIKKANGKMLFKATIVSDKMEITLDDYRDVKFVVYDFTGNVVADGRGREWDLKNRAGRFVANGAYLVVVEATDKNGKVERYSAKLGIKR
jgi:uncharacterized repeat protein (TIGR02543 family)